MLEDQINCRIVITPKKEHVAHDFPLEVGPGGL